MVCSDTGVRVGDGKGAALHLQAITAAFAGLGHQTEVVGVAANADGPLEPWSVPQHLVPHPGRAEGALRERRKREVVELVALVGTEAAARLRPDVVYERLSLFGTAGQRIAAASGARHALEVNALLAVEEARWRGLTDAPLAARTEASVLAAADLRVAVSEEVAAQVSAVAAGPVVVVPNGVDVDLFARLPARADARARLGLPQDGRLLCFTGSLRPWHGLDVAVEALALLPDDVHVVVAGDGPVRGEIARRADELGVGARVHWLGQLPHGLVPVVLAACDVALAPYPDLREFAFSPLKLYEYLASGTPVVASAIGQIPQCLGQGRWGGLVTPGDPRALADGVAQVLGDPEAALSRAGRARDHALGEHGWSGRAAQILAALPERRAEVGRALAR